MSFLRGLTSNAGNAIAQGPMVSSFTQPLHMMGKLGADDMRDISKASGLIGALALGGAALGGGASGAAAGGSSGAGTASAAGGANLGGAGYGAAPAIGPYAAASTPIASAPMNPMLAGALKAGGIYGGMNALNSMFGPPPLSKGGNLGGGGIQSSKQNNRPRGR